jgi:transposase
MPQTPTAATKLALRLVAVRYQQLSAEITELNRHLQRLVAAAAPRLLALKGVGTDIAAALLLAAGDNPQRLRSEAAFARLCGLAPIPASSGKTSRHRLSRGGNRDATGPCTCWLSAACAGTHASALCRPADQRRQDHP